MQRKVRLKNLLNNETYSALALAAATVAALVWANIGSSYESVWSTEFGFTTGSFTFQLPLSEWVDEGLMALFFFMVGLDVRRELTLGELRTKERAILPVVAALGGLAAPALIFLLVTWGEGYSTAWGSVISTDTAFALGMLALIGPRNAPRLKVFLLALAVVDDIGALSVIAVFYTDDLNIWALALGILGLAGVWALQKLNVWRVMPYAVLGIYTWACFYASGVHATLAGVLIALIMPVYPPRRRDVVLASRMFQLFRQAPQPDMARSVRAVVSYSVPLNQRLSAVLPPYVNYIVVPLFALANAGVALTPDALGSAFTSKLTWGVVLGLVVGKAVGITAAAACVLKLVPSSRLPGLDLPRIAGAAALSGMGFTISLLVVGLAIDDGAVADQARVGVLLASVVALLCAWVVFRAGERFRPLPPPAGMHLDREVDPETDHIRGDLQAPATLVVYAAMNLAYRHDTAEALSQVRRVMGDRVRMVLRHHTTSEAARTAALALEAAGAQGRFWEMHDELTRIRPEIDNDLVSAAAERVGLDVAKFEERINRQIDRGRVDDDNLDLEEAEAGSAPIVYINGTRFDGPLNSLAMASGVRRALDTQPA
ncbi:Na+/H+ antiporter NhaA [Kocuria coralli]|uniref:Na(+)/H(+) antiporter NhaA n=1 Tax=Kocuria coralli TaxID=1461025 RepID=A0A5J5KVU2_9MICC|nr:Na+/H+ antiporter NhaA [Kocuria coralli]KAA9393508.1 Na+/H+ antiporter NhaA [Kocuria coralli]